MLTKRVQRCFSAMPSARANSQAWHRRGSDVANLSSLDHVVQRLKRLFDRRFVIEAMDLIEVDVIHAEPGQAGVDLDKDRLARQPGAIGARAHAAVNLGRDYHFVAPRKIPNRPAEDLLAVAERVAIGGVEEIDAGFERLLDERSAFLFVEAPGVVPAVAAAIAHAAEADA
jgi:hypothetical protein